MLSHVGLNDEGLCLIWTLSGLFVELFRGTFCSVTWLSNMRTLFIRLI